MKRWTWSEVGSLLGLIGLFFFGPAILAMSGSPTRTERTIEQTVAQAGVLVTLEQGHGSGVVIAPGIVLTNRHVAGGETGIKITLSTGVVKDAKLLWTGDGDDNDVALLAATTDDVTPAALACRKVAVGEDVVAFGFPLGMGATTTYGRVANPKIADPKAPADAVLLDLHLAPGNSGGGVYTRDGRLVGLSQAMIMARSGLGATTVGLSVMVPSTTLCRLLGRTK